MIPDISQYFLDHCWNFQHFHQVCPLTPLYKKNYGNILTRYYFSYLNMLEIQKFQKEMTLSDIKQVELISVLFFFQNLVVQKQLASPSVFREFYDGILLINLWNPQILKARVKPTKSNIFFEKRIDNFS